MGAMPIPHERSAAGYAHASRTATLDMRDLPYKPLQNMNENPRISPPGPAAIHVWFLNLAADGENGYFWDCLNPEERYRAERFRSPAARTGFLRARGRLRILLGQYLDRDPGAIEFIHNSHGKPRLADTLENQGLVFNISHSGDYAVLAFAQDTSLGVDIEWPKPRLELEGLAGFCLAAQEQECWRRLPAAGRLAGFIRYWVCKEAFVKAAGRGIALGLTQVCVSPDFSGFANIPEAYGPAQDWHLREWDYQGHRVALAYRGSPRGIGIFA